MEEDLFGVLLVEVCKDLLGEGVHMIRNTGCWVSERVRIFGGEMVRRAVDAQGREITGDLDLGRLSFVGFSRNLFEFGVRG